MRSKKGSQFIEASLIYPIIIVISVVSILLMVFFYSCSETAAVMSMDIRALSGESAGTVGRISQDSDSESDRKNCKSTLSYDIYEERGLLYSEFAASCRASFKADGWFGISGVKEFSARRSCVNEAESIWRRQCAEEIVGDDKGEE